MKKLKSLVNSALNAFDAVVVRRSSYEKLLASADRFRDYELSQLIGDQYFFEYFENLKFSKSQLRQDLFALSEVGFKKNGFFVEFGATNGIEFSNTHLLETRFAWRGILSEPARSWHLPLKANRVAAIETDCVWRCSGERLVFREVRDDYHAWALSTIDDFANADGHAKTRNAVSETYEVRSISLEDMLRKHNAPRIIDYLSIDTEGSEFEILNAFDFSSFDIKVITCEHNYTSNRQRICDLLEENGYERKFEEFSRWDDWYVKRDDCRLGASAV